MGKWIKISVSLLCILFGSYYLMKSYKVLKEGDKQHQLIKGIDNKVIERLMIARDLQLHYLAIHGEYAPHWDTLFNFVRNGEIFTVQEKEVIAEENGKEVVYVERDTVGVRQAYDSLKNRMGGIALKDIERLKYAPGHEEGKKVEFFINADFIGKQPVFEVSDPEPLNPKRQKPKNQGGLPALKVGSMDSPSIKGNWEY